MTTGDRSWRGQAGLDRLMLFILVVILFLLVTPTVLGLFGIDVVGGEDGDSNDPDGVVVSGNVEGPVQILGARGTAIDAEQGTVGTVKLTVAPGTTEGTVDLREYTVGWLSDRSYRLVPEGEDGGDGTFSYADQRLTDPGNTTTITIDVAGTDAFEGPLTAGQTVTVVLTAPGGESVEHELTVPDPMPNESSVSL